MAKLQWSLQNCRLSSALYVERRKFEYKVGHKSDAESFISRRSIVVIIRMRICHGGFQLYRILDCFASHQICGESTATCNFIPHCCAAVISPRKKYAHRVADGTAPRVVFQ